MFAIRSTSTRGATTALLSVAAALALPATAGAVTYTSRALNEAPGKGLKVTGPLTGYTASSHARITVPTAWSSRRAPAGKLSFTVRQNGSCTYDLTYSVRSVLSSTQTATAYVTAGLPAAGAAYILDSGTHGNRAFRVVRQKGLNGRVRVDALWAGVLTRRTDIAPAGKVAWTQISVSAISRLGSECHSGTWRQSLGPSIGDTLAVARTTLHFERTTVRVQRMSAATALASAAAAADAPLATGLPSNVKVSMRGDAVAWSAPASGGRYKLVVRTGGITRDVAVPTSPQPFDVDLGDDGHGHLLATYSRCSVRRVGLQRPRGCDVYRYDFTAARERRVSGLGNGSASDYLPTASSGRIAFARSVAGGPARLYRRNLDGGSLTALPGGLRNSDNRTGPTSLDLGTRSLAIAWVARGPVSPDYGYGAQEARIDLLRGGSRLLARYTQGDISGTDVAGISVSGFNGALWGAQGNGEDSRSRLYLVPNYEESSDSRYLTYRIQSVSGDSLTHAAALTCTTSETAPDCSVVLIG